MDSNYHVTLWADEKCIVVKKHFANQGQVGRWVETMESLGWAVRVEKIATTSPQSVNKF
jgi:hypothetical protein